MLHSPETHIQPDTSDEPSPEELNAQRIHASLIETLSSTDQNIPFSRPFQSYGNLAVVSRLITESALDLREQRAHVARSRIKATQTAVDFTRSSKEPLGSVAIHQSELVLQEILLDMVESPENIRKNREQYYATIMGQLAIATHGALNNSGKEQKEWYTQVQKLCIHAFVHRELNSQLISAPAPTHHNNRIKHTEHNYSMLIVATANVDSANGLSVTQCAKTRVNSRKRRHNHDESINIVYANQLLGHRVVPNLKIPTAGRLMGDYLENVELHPLQQKKLRETSRKVLKALLP